MANTFICNYAGTLPTTPTALAVGNTNGGWVVGTITIVNTTSSLVSYSFTINNGTTTTPISPGAAQVQPNGMTVYNLGKTALNSGWTLFGSAGSANALQVTASFNIVSP
jgi:hypothetical protein